MPSVSPSLRQVAALAAACLTGLLATLLAAGESPNQQHIVEVRKLEFSPSELAVAPGDTVVWINKDIIPHTITADDESWDSDFVDTDADWQTVVEAGMSETYFCRFHPTMKARLRIVPRLTDLDS